MLVVPPTSSFVDESLLNIVASSPDESLLTVHPYLLCEIAQQHASFFDVYISSLLLHLQHITEPTKCPVQGIFCLFNNTMLL
jgi:hypothetical protein